MTKQLNPININDRTEVKIAVVAEKVSNIERSQDDMKTNFEKDLGELKTSIRDLISKIDGNYVTRTEFLPVRAIVYGLISLIVLAVVGAIISLVVLQ